MGAKTPAPVLRGIELYDKAHLLALPNPQPLLALSDDRFAEVLVDYAIQRHVGQPGEVGLNAGLETIERQLLAEVNSATLPLLDDLVAGLQSVFDQVVSPIQEAVRRYGFTGTTSAEDVLNRRRAEDSEAFMAARDAVAGLQR